MKVTEKTAKAQEMIFTDIKNSVDDYNCGYINDFDLVGLWGITARSTVNNPLVIEKREQLTEIFFQMEESRVDKMFKMFDIKRFKDAIKNLSKNPVSDFQKRNILSYVESANSLLQLKTIHITFDIHNDNENFDFENFKYNPLDSVKGFDIRKYIPSWITLFSSNLQMCERMVMSNADKFISVYPHILSMGVLTAHQKYRPNLYHYLSSHLWDKTGWEGNMLNTIKEVFDNIKQYNGCE